MNTNHNIPEGYSSPTNEVTPNPTGELDDIMSAYPPARTVIKQGTGEFRRLQEHLTSLSE